MYLVQLALVKKLLPEDEVFSQNKDEVHDLCMWRISGKAEDEFLDIRVVRQPMDEIPPENGDGFTVVKEVLQRVQGITEGTNIISLDTDVVQISVAWDDPMGEFEVK